MKLTLEDFVSLKFAFAHHDASEDSWETQFLQWDKFE